MREDGIDLYVHRFIANSHARALHEKYPDDKMETEQIDASETVTVAGRVMLVRSFGKAGFITLDDESGRIQVYVKSGVTDEAGFNLFKKWLDAGDIVGATGTLFRTKPRADDHAPTEAAHQVHAPVAEKWHAEGRPATLRRRYVDLITTRRARRFRLARGRSRSSGIPRRPATWKSRRDDAEI